MLKTVAKYDESSVDITGGTINGASIGASSASSGAFTTLSATGDVTIADKIIHAGDTDTSIRFPAADTVTIETAGLERVRVDSSGRVGVGVTPSAWSTFKTVQLPGGTIAGLSGGGGNIQMNIVNNGYFDGGSYRYISDGTATQYLTYSSTHRFTTASSGTAGDPITFNERFNVGNAETVVNDPGNNYNFRVESDTNTHALYVWGFHSRVGINNSAPSEALEVSGNIKTTAPTGGTAAAWKLGTVASVSPTSPDRTIEVEINGQIYYLHAKTTND